MTTPDTAWHIFKHDAAEPHDGIAELLKDPPPEWRNFQGELPKTPPEPVRKDEPEKTLHHARKQRGKKFQASREEAEMVNAALYLRRPLLVTGDPGTGKSSLAYAVAHQLDLGEVLYWPVTTRSTLQEALYAYDAIGRLQETDLFHRFGKAGTASDPAGGGPEEGAQTSDRCDCDPPDIGQFITLGPLGTALLPSERPRVLLIDEIDKSDIDLPNDLLNVFEEGGFDIPELKRMAERQAEISVFTCDDRKATVRNGRILCRAFPFVALTSNRERELPAPFLRRCLRLDIPRPDETKLERIVRAHFPEADAETLERANALISRFLEDGENGKLLSTDQLLNAVFLAARGIDMDREELRKVVMRDLNETGPDS
jgi:MoxR-like ATPase